MKKQAIIAALIVGLTVTGCSSKTADTATGAGTTAVAEAPAETPAAAEPAQPEVSADFKSALNKAGTYVEVMHLSKAGLFDQLTSQYADKFSAEAAQYAVDNVKADWSANALAQAKNYRDTMSMSTDAIREQLTSEFGGKFTADEAESAMQHLAD